MLLIPERPMLSFGVSQIQLAARDIHTCDQKTGFTESILLETGDIPSSPNQQTVLYPSKGFRLPAPHPFVDDAVTCDSSEANRAWSSLPAVPCLPLTDRQGPCHSTHPASKIHMFFSVGRASFFQAMQRCFRTMDSTPAQRERGGNMTFQHHLFWTAPTVHIVEMTKDQTGREA